MHAHTQAAELPKKVDGLYLTTPRYRYPATCIYLLQV